MQNNDSTVTFRESLISLEEATMFDRLSVQLFDTIKGTAHGKFAIGVVALVVLVLGGAYLWLEYSPPRIDFPSRIRIVDSPAHLELLAIR